MLLSPIGKYVASSFPQSEEESFQVALKYDLIYAHSGYVYTILLDLPTPCDANASVVSHATNDIIGYLLHPYAPPHMSYVYPKWGTSSSNIYPPPRNLYLGHNRPYAFSRLHQSMLGPVV